MPGIVQPNLGLKTGYDDGESSWGVDGFTPNFNLLDRVVMGGVITGISAPPGSPTAGQRWIIGPSPTGVWAGRTNQLATWLASAWVYDTPRTGWRFLSTTAGRFVYYNGSAWVNELPATDLQYIAGFVPGAMFPNEKLMRFVVPTAMTLAANFGGSTARAAAAATATTVVDIQRGVTPIGSVTFAAGSASGVFASVGGAGIGLSVNDTLVLIAPSTADTTLADISFTIAATTSYP